MEANMLAEGTYANTLCKFSNAVIVKLRLCTATLSGFLCVCVRSNVFGLACSALTPPDTLFISVWQAEKH